MEKHGTDNGKIDYLEREVHSLGGRISGLERSFEAQMDAIKHLGAKIDGVRTKKTDWATIGTWLGVGVVIWGMALAPVYRAVALHDSDLRKIMATRWTAEQAHEAHILLDNRSQQRYENMWREVKDKTTDIDDDIDRVYDRLNNLPGES